MKWFNQNFKNLNKLSICDIGNITYRLTMAKYLPILSRGDTER
jgi:hypothetical protein